MTRPDPDTGEVDVLFIGNATLLIRFRELTLLTDPNFLHRGEHVHLGYGLLSRRLADPALDIGELPASPDAVLLSHFHGDHWDRVARRRLDRALPVITTPHASRRLQGLHGFHRALGLRTWESHTVSRGESGVRVTSLPGRHAFGAVGRLLPPVMGSLLEFGPMGGPAGVRLYITGDTLLFDGLDEIAAAYPDVHLAVLHLGGTTLPGGFLVTMDGRQGAELVDRLRPRAALPVHYDDYTVMKSPLGDFFAEAEKRGLAGRIVHCPRGRSVTVRGDGDIGPA